MKQLYQLAQYQTSAFQSGISEPYYHVLLFDGNGAFSVDFTVYSYTGKTMLFLAPYQFFKWMSGKTSIRAVVFHGDFYCIEYHEKEVACNGLLFNNIYQLPHIAVSATVFKEVSFIMDKMKPYEHARDGFDGAIVRTYLQLILALGSKEKQQQLDSLVLNDTYAGEISGFRELLEANFIQYREASFYASQYGLTVNTFSKKVKGHFRKTPSTLIQERVIMESKKLLHLTHKTIKQIAAILHFEDEFYFSRYFKKAVGISPKHYRKMAGISIVAKKSM